MIKVNLVPPELLAKAQQKQRTAQLSFLGGLVGLILLGISAGHFYKAKRLERELAAGEAELKKLAIIVAKVEELDKAAAAVRARLKVINDLLKARALYPVFMSDFVRSVPSGIWVKSLSTTSSPGGVIKLSITGEARVSEDIAAWVKTLDATGKFSSTEMGAVAEVAGGDGGRALSFSLVSTYTAKL